MPSPQEKFIPTSITNKISGSGTPERLNKIAIAGGIITAIGVFTFACLIISNLP